MLETKSERHEIRVVTGPNGNVVGSQVFVNGQELQNITSFSLVGNAESGVKWQISIDAPSSFTVSSPEEPQQMVVGEIGDNGKPKFSRLEQESAIRST